MNGTNAKKFLRLLSYLAAHPQHITNYWGSSVSKRSPLDLQIPWISFSAIEFLEDFLKPHHSVAEYGGGGSTMYFAKKVRQVLCMESHQKWADLIIHHVKNDNLANVTLDTLPFDPQDLNGFADSAYLHGIDHDEYDIILVDGYEEDVQLRPTCFRHAENHIRPGGIIIVDDSWRYPFLRKKNRAKSWEEFRSIGPCRIGVTSTDIFFY